MSRNLLAELRRHQRDYPSLVHATLCGQAADEIERLRAEKGKNFPPAAVGAPITNLRTSEAKMNDPDVEFFNKTLDKFLDIYIAKGCCSSVSPCSHQQRDRMSICEGCKAAGEWAARRDCAHDWVPNGGRGSGSCAVITCSKCGASR